ncbi:hypothetical protein BC939DRAFT_83584 [Gamsiella multidivaricata]|uniref:uncharacterized protein n=1 Tax=Gamsiella multidivaricata TaxID=101098 RepID=UPI00221EBB51|nr:uncharacterized protein BC939DRAFT_83584 [Gamsiella multidivaricata]KAI7815825.1 hypothetical protein BC939DRAFT_83584 [Gamsiella multidivaricata]
MWNTIYSSIQIGSFLTPYSCKRTSPSATLIIAQFSVLLISFSPLHPSPLHVTRGRGSNLTASLALFPPLLTFSHFPTFPLSHLSTFPPFHFPTFSLSHFPFFPHPPFLNPSGTVSYLFHLFSLFCLSQVRLCSISISTAQRRLIGISARSDEGSEYPFTRPALFVCRPSSIKNWNRKHFIGADYFLSW